MQDSYPPKVVQENVIVCKRQTASCYSFPDCPVLDSYFFPSWSSQYDICEKQSVKTGKCRFNERKTGTNQKLHGFFEGQKYCLQLKELQAISTKRNIKCVIKTVYTVSFATDKTYAKFLLCYNSMSVFWQVNILSENSGSYTEVQYSFTLYFVQQLQALVPDALYEVYPMILFNLSYQGLF